MKIIQSASKIVFILMTMGLIGLTYMKIVDNKDFVVLVSMVFTYYFTRTNQPQV